MKHKIIDANGKEFEISISDVCDMTTDMCENSIQLEDSEKFSMGSFNAEIVDSEGNTVDVARLLDESKNGQATLPAAIDVLFEATHSGINRNSWNYHSDSMLKDANTWKFPYAKPFLKNHDMYSEPMGRVRDAYHGVSEFNNERDCINVVYRINDKEAIEKFLDGRYKTMSIGGSVNHVQCSICGKDILKDGTFKFCGHWRGETYAGQKAVWNGRDIEYKEGSIVNSPADDWAQVKKITIINPESNKDNNEDESNNPNSANDSTDDLASIIDAAVPTNEGQANDNAQTEGDNTEGTPDAEDNNQDNNNQDNEGENNEPNEASDEIKTLKETITSKDEEIANLNKKIEDLNSNIANLEDNSNSLKIENETLKDDYVNSKKNFINMAVAYKSTMAKRVADGDLVKGLITKDKYDDRVKELVGKSAKDLQELSDAVDVSVSSNGNSNTPIARVNNPSLSNTNDEHSINDDETEAKDNKESKKSYKDIEDSIINSIFKD